MAPAIDFETALNDEQYDAVTHEGGPQLLIAGAGSGKTRAITYRVAWLVQEQGVDPSLITAVTFTNKAAAEMRERIEELLGLYPLPAFVGTFHRFSLRLLRMYGQRVSLPRDFSILDSSDQMTLVKRAMKAAGVPEESFRPRAVLSAISAAKNQLMGPARYGREADDFFTRKVAAAYQHYQSQLRDAGGVDFDDMIRLSVQLLRTQPTILKRVRQRVRFLLVDEFQDTNHAQMALIHELVGNDGQITAVGDEDQGIYRWRGAELSNILGFEKTFERATVRKLEQNYRSTQTILDASGAVVANNEQRRGKELWTESGEGEKLIVYRARDEQDEARWIANTLSGLESDYGGFGNLAVLVRTNAQTRALEDAFLRQGVPYNLIAGVRFYERAEIKDLIAYLRLLRNPEDPLSFERVLNRPARGIGKQSQEKFRALAESLQKSPWRVLDEKLPLDSLPNRGRKAIQRFYDLIVELQRLADGLPLPAVLRHILDATGYLDQYDRNSSEDIARIENIEELLSSAEEFTEKNAYGAETDDLLAAFLDHVALVSDTDGLGAAGVALMTMHSAKGLEFKGVVVAGLEEGLLPHYNSKSSVEDLEEERRLLYVGMTRAEERLVITTCKRRRIAGSYQDQEESRFLSEIPGEHVVAEHSSELFAAPGGSRGHGYGGGSSGYGGSRSYGSFGTSRNDAGSDGEPRGFEFQTFGSSSSRKKSEGSTQTEDIYSFFGKKAPAEGASSPAESEGESPAAAVSPPGPQRLPFEPETPQGGLLKRGSRVRHKKLGLGKIMHIEGSGSDARLIVYFEGVGRRKLMAKYANLDVL
ncbi:MAG: UvrD-helicase domain-containing protein [Acidobacteriota bacterium]